MDNRMVTTWGRPEGTWPRLLLWIGLALVLGDNPALAQQQAKPPAAPVADNHRQERLKERDRFDHESHKLWSDGKLPEAIAAAEKMLAIEREVYVLEDDHLADSLDWLAQLHAERNDFAIARKLGQERLALCKRLHRDDDWRVSDARRGLAFLEQLSALSVDQRKRIADANRLMQKLNALDSQGKFREALEFCREALSTYKDVLGEQNHSVDFATEWLGSLYYAIGDYAQAEPTLRQAMEIRKKVLGENHPDYANSLNSLAGLYLAQGKSAQAEPLFRQAMEIRKKVLGENDPAYANSLSNLGSMYRIRGDYARAEPLYRQALELRKKVLGESHPDYAISLNNLAFLYKVQGHYAQAEPLYRQASEIWKKVHGEDHPDYALSLNNLAGLYDAQGAYAKAEPFYRHAMEIYKRVLGENHPDYANSLNNLAGSYVYQGAYAKAEPLYRQALEIRKKALGENHPDFANSLRNLAGLYASQGDYARAEPFYLQAMKIRKKALGENHPDYADSLSELAVLYFHQGAYARAEPLYLQILAIKKKVFGENHREYAMSLNNLAGLYQAQGDYARAEPLFHQASQIYKKALGENHPDYANSLNNLAGLYECQGDYARAERLYLQATEIRKKVFGENHPDYANGLGNLAGLYIREGAYARAEPLELQVVKIRKKALGENHPDYALSLHNLASVYFREGDYARAEPLYCQARDVWKRALGENHPLYTHSLKNLAGLYRVQGDYARAESLFLQVLEIRKKALGANHPYYAESLTDLARLYMDQRDYARAEPLFHQSLEIQKKILGENHPDYADSLNNLAVLYVNQGYYALAEPLHLQALEIRKKALGENHPDYAVSLDDLASLYKAQGEYARAEPYFLQALEIEKKVLGENHPSYAITLCSLALLYRAQGDYARAEPLVRQAVTIQCNQLEATAATQSERQQLVMLDSVRSYLNYYLTLSASKDQFSTSAYRLMLAWKGMVFRRERLARAGEQTPELAALFRQLQQVAGQLAKLAWATPDPKQADRWKKNVAALSEKKEQLEAELSTRSAAFRRAKAPSTLEDLQAALPKDVVLIDFLEFWNAEIVAVPQRGGLGVRFDQTSGGTKITEVIAGGAAAQNGQLQPGDLIVEITDHTGNWTTMAGKSSNVAAQLMSGDVGSNVSLRIEQGEDQEPQEITLTRTALPGQKKFDWRGKIENVAFVVQHDGPVVRLNLGPAKPISEAIDTWRETCGTSPPSAAAGRLLREKVWEPIAAQIQGAKIVLLSPDGALSKLPLGALPGKEAGKYLIEEHPLAIVPTAQMIPEIVRDETRKPLPENLLLVGNIDYDGRPGQTTQAPSGPKETIRGAPQGFVHFNRLPATQREVALIEKLYHQDFGAAGIETLEEDQATKAAFLAQAGRYRYLHLATHGFFIQEKLPTALTQAHRGAEQLGGPQSAELHVGLLSGLALTGANQAGKAAGATPDSPADNGILTAEEIGAQNLDGVQLVMLSACETGLGKAAGGEGLLGLQRSFQAAGARSVVASLWKVPDEETKALMGAFYTNLWQRKLSPLESLRQAQLTMLRSYDPQAGRLRAPDFSQTMTLPTDGAAEKPAAGRPTRLSPVYWAAFVLSGDWR